MTRVQWPTPAQIGAYLTARGWRLDRPMKQPGAVYVSPHPTDSGNEIQVFVPDFDPNADAAEDFASSVSAVAETVAGLEGCRAEDVVAEMLAPGVTPAPRPPSAVVK
jgi:hypothetical protein